MVSKTNAGAGFSLSLLWRLALITPVIAAVLAEPGLLVEEAATVTEEGLDLLPGESMSSRVKREYTNNRAARRRVFKQTDLNGDGLVTRKEYVMKNGNMTEEELDILFGAFDVDGDRSLSQDEFVRHGFIWMVVEDCEMEAIQRCDDEFVRLIRGDAPSTSTEDNQQGTLCRAFQTYFNCIEHEQHTCDITAYSQAVVDLVDTYRTINFCPELDFAGLLSLPDDEEDEINGHDDGMDIDIGNDDLMEEQSEMLSSDQDAPEIGGAELGVHVGYRTKRADHKAPKHHGFRFPWSRLGISFGVDTDSPSITSGDNDNNDKNHGRISCTSSSLASCTWSFNDELRRNPYADLCDSLSDYRHCIKRHARRCPEFELVEVEESLRKWLHLHQRLDLC